MRTVLQSLEQHNTNLLPVVICSRSAEQCHEFADHVLVPLTRRRSDRCCHVPGGRRQVVVVVVIVCVKCQQPFYNVQLV